MTNVITVNFAKPVDENASKIALLESMEYVAASMAAIGTGVIPVLDDMADLKASLTEALDNLVKLAVSNVDVCQQAADKDLLPALLSTLRDDHLTLDHFAVADQHAKTNVETMYVRKDARHMYHEALELIRAIQEGAQEALAHELDADAELLEAISALADLLTNMRDVIVSDWERDNIADEVVTLFTLLNEHHPVDGDLNKSENDSTHELMSMMGMFPVAQ
jgi:hypothetical protein